MEQHLEIYKHLEELYHADTTDEAIFQYAEKNQAKMQAWKEAFEGYYLHDVLNVIDEYFAKKNNRTPPRIPQIIAMLNAQNIHAENEVHEKREIPQPTFGVKFAHQDAETGDMNWLVPEYQEVEYLIRRDYFPFVQNIYNPTYDEFRECMKRHSMDIRGTKHHFPSANDINRMTAEQRAEFEQAARNFDLSSIVKRLN